MLKFVFGEWLMYHLLHAAAERQFPPVRRSICCARHDVAGDLQLREGEMRMLAAPKLVFFEDELVDFSCRLVAIHLLHLQVHDDELKDAVPALAAFLEALFNHFDGHSAVIGLLNALKRVGDVGVVHEVFFYEICLDLEVEGVVVDHEYHGLAGAHGLWIVLLFLFDMVFLDQDAIASKTL